MRKSNSVLIGIVVVIVLAVGAFAIFHKSSKAPVSSSSASQGTTAAAVNNAVLVTKTDSKLGQYLATPSGAALYTYGGDAQGVSNCTGECLSTWPAYQDTGSTTGLPTGVSTIKRTDNGELQYTYQGMPLYTFASDSAGQVTGNGVNNFSVAKPVASSSSSSTTSTTPSSSSPSSSSGSPY